MTTELARTDSEPAATLFAGATPTELISAATQAADALADVIRQKRLFQKIGQREHVLVEGWQACGTLVGVFAVKDGGVHELPWPELAEPDGTPELDRLIAAKQKGLAYGFIAAYRAVKDGREVGWGEGRCTRAERNWRDRDDYALSSMAQTRGQSRALRQPLGFIVSLAGYATTPAEEMNGAGQDPDPGHGPVADADSLEEAAGAVHAVLPDIDGHAFIRILSRRFENTLPESAAITLKALAWWVEQPQAATGAKTEQE